MHTDQSQQFILASGSPRRSFLLKACGFDFVVNPSQASEEFDDTTLAEEVPSLLAIRKAEASRNVHPNARLILTADTVVILNNQILNKPVDEADAIRMLGKLSNNSHVVITAVALSTTSTIEVITCRSIVRFLSLNPKEIAHYVEHFRPLDKAGAYGAQECLPDHYNPCSQEEINFLKVIGKPDLLQNSKPQALDVSPLIAIKEIEGSYFNVMGLPIHLIYASINSILSKK